MRGMEACKSEQEGQRREKEEELYADLEALKAQLDDFERRNAALHGETLLPAACPACLLRGGPAGRACSLCQQGVRVSSHEEGSRYFSLPQNQIAWTGSHLLVPLRVRVATLSEQIVCCYSRQGM